MKPIDGVTPWLIGRKFISITFKPLTFPYTKNSGDDKASTPTGVIYYIEQ